MKKSIAVIGSGYVGLVTGAGLAQVGHEVICCDISKEKIDMLNNGKIPIYEPGLEEVIKENVRAKRLSFTTDTADAIKKSEVIFSAVGTPMGENHEADLRFVRDVAITFGENLNGYKVFVNKSTVPVGTGKMVKEIVSSITDMKFDVVSNPEFLKEGAAVKDFLNPDRIVIGSESSKAKEIMDEVYLPFARAQSPIFHTSIESAELIKYGSNAMLATRISFMNELANFAQKVGADITDVAKGMGMDKRIGPRFLHAGCGYGGSCFPKDVAALIVSAKDYGVDLGILNSVEKANQKQKTVPVEKLKERLGTLSGKKIALWGLSFKPRTDDVREAPAYYMAKMILDEGGIVNAYDPEAMENFEKAFGLHINYFNNSYDALKGCDAMILVTEWDEFRSLDYERIKTLMKEKIIVDGRNIFDSTQVRDEGFDYIGIGRN